MYQWPVDTQLGQWHSVSEQCSDMQVFSHDAREQANKPFSDRQLK